ncbi:tetratricopeptide repeat protein [Terriglobus albidus]|uniref:tetratricopeptide repeat protein n=1 Tax=Terriglobus albidus TaxID=1592106 RepID=UPI00164D2E13|nr:tetratricopeptide repeat protein [Terriglobus albidus]
MSIRLSSICLMIFVCMGGVVVSPLPAQQPCRGAELKDSGKALERTGDRQGAIRLYQQAERDYERCGQQVEAVRLANDLADLYMAAGEMKKSYQQKLIALKGFQQAKDAANVFRASVAIATILFTQKKKDEASHYLDMARVAAQTATLSDDDRAMLLSLEGAEMQLAGSPEAALPCFREALRLWIAANGPGHPDAGWAHLLLGQGLAIAGRPEPALQELQAAISILHMTQPRNDPHYVFAVKEYAHVLEMAGRKSEAKGMMAAAFQ